MATQIETIPELRDGDRLSVAEFERRYTASPHIRKAELIEGVVYEASPVNSRHGRPHSKLAIWLGFYLMDTPGIDTMIDSTVRLDLSNQPQPDILMLILPEFGGQASFSHEGYVVGSPELAAEVSFSSKSYDLKLKLEVYRRNSIREYLVWLVEDQAIFWYVLRDGRYERLPLDADGLYKSEVFPGLWLDAKALIANDLARVFQVVMLGKATTEYAGFVAKLGQTQNEG